MHKSLPKKENIDKQTLENAIYQTMIYYRSVGDDKSLLRITDLEKMIQQREKII